MKKFTSFGFFTLFLAVLAGTSYAATFENGFDHMWVDTPQGRFECHNDKSTDYSQILKLNGKAIFKEIKGPSDIQEGSTITSGILDLNLGCPSVLASNQGYVVITRATQPPHYGIQGYAIINFNKPNPTLKSLGEGFSPKDEKISLLKRLQWFNDGVMLNYFGYTLDETVADINSPKPKMHKIRYTFSNESVERLK